MIKKINVEFVLFLFVNKREIILILNSKRRFVNGYIRSCYCRLVGNACTVVKILCFCIFSVQNNYIHIIVTCATVTVFVVKIGYILNTVLYVIIIFTF